MHTSNLLSVEDEIGYETHTRCNTKRLDNSTIERVKERLRNGESLRKIVVDEDIEYANTYKKVSKFMKELKTNVKNGCTYLDKDIDTYGDVLRLGVIQVGVDANITEYMLNGMFDRLNVMPLCKNCTHKSGIDMHRRLVSTLLEQHKKDIDRVKSNYCKYDNVYDLSKELGLGVYYVCMVLDYIGVEVVQDCPDVDTLKMIEDYKNGDTFESIGEKYGLSRNTVRYRLINNCKDIRDEYRDIMEYKVVKGINKGLSLASMSRNLCISVTTLVKLMIESDNRKINEHLKSIKGSYGLYLGL